MVSFVYGATGSGHMARPAAEASQSKRSFRDASLPNVLNRVMGAYQVLKR
jgi:hypothetical protein